jgi:hypothetical protein
MFGMGGSPSKEVVVVSVVVPRRRSYDAGGRARSKVANLGQKNQIGVKVFPSGFPF